MFMKLRLDTSLDHLWWPCQMIDLTLPIFSFPHPWWPSDKPADLNTGILHLTKSAPGMTTFWWKHLHNLDIYLHTVHNSSPFNMPCRPFSRAMFQTTQNCHDASDFCGTPMETTWWATWPVNYGALLGCHVGVAATATTHFQRRSSRTSDNSLRNFWITVSGSVSPQQAAKFREHCFARYQCPGCLGWVPSMF